MIELLKAQADKGNFSHLSVYAQWGAHKSPTVFHAAFVTPYGQGHADNIDPVAAIIEAIEKAPKEKQRHTPTPVVGLTPKPQKQDSAHNPVEVPALAPAPVMGQPVKPLKDQNNRKTQQGQGIALPRRGQGLVSTPNLMDLFK